MFAVTIQIICLQFSFLLKLPGNRESFFFFPKFFTQQSLAYFLRLIFSVNFPDHTVTIKHLFFGYLGKFISNSISSSYYVLFYSELFPPATVTSVSFMLLYFMLLSCLFLNNHVTYYCLCDMTLLLSFFISLVLILSMWR